MHAVTLWAVMCDVIGYIDVLLPYIYVYTYFLTRTIDTHSAATTT